METLIAQAGLSLKQRCVLFHRVFPEVFISPQALHRLYRKHSIRRKVIRKVKDPPPTKSE